MQNASEAMFSFGVLGDLQYADVDDAYDFHRTARRYYRNTLQVLESAIDEWNKHPLVCIVQMGDLLDGFCHRGADPRVALATVRKTQERAVCKSWHNVIGNHELYNFDRAELRELLNVHYGGATDYYSFSPYAGWRIVILDAYDISIIGRDKESPEYKEALTILQSNNPNNVLEFVDWIQGLEGTQRRFLPYNGSMSQAQLTWLDRTLADATAANERVIVVSHVPLHLCCCGPTVLVWNYEEVLRVLHRYHCVAAVLYGHEHKGGRGVDEHGIHHIIFEAPLECPPGETAFGVMQVYEDRIELLGYGRVAPLTIPLNPLPTTTTTTTTTTDNTQS